MSAELKQLFHNPEELSDAELDVMRVKLQNMRRVPKIAFGMGFMSCIAADVVILRRNPVMATAMLGGLASYMLAGHAMTMNTSGNVLKREFDVDILIAHEERQVKRTFNVSGYGSSYISSNDNVDGQQSYEKPY